MRVIKFRAWSKTQKKMLDRVLAGPGDPCSIVYDEERGEWVNFDEACGTIMQFTGLTNKNGVEIYEGDIMRTESAGFGRVLMDEKGFWGIKLFNIQGKPVHHLFYHARSGVVVGNLYEHPNLL